MLGFVVKMYMKGHVTLTKERYQETYFLLLLLFKIKDGIFTNKFFTKFDYCQNLKILLLNAIRFSNIITSIIIIVKIYAAILHLNK